MILGNFLFTRFDQPVNSVLSIANCLFPAALRVLCRQGNRIVQIL